MYALSWAETVVSNHYKKHARAAYYVLCRSPILPKTLSLWVARRDPRWELFKKLVSFLETFLISPQEAPEYYTNVSLNWLSAMDQTLEQLAHTPWQAVLTHLQVCPMLKKQSFKARAALPVVDGAETAPVNDGEQLFMEALF